MLSSLVLRALRLLQMIRMNKASSETFEEYFLVDRGGRPPSGFQAAVGRREIPSPRLQAGEEAAIDMSPRSGRQKSLLENALDVSVARYAGSLPCR